MNIEVLAKVIIPLLGAIITYILIPYVRAKTTKEQRDNVYFWVRVAVGLPSRFTKSADRANLRKSML